MTEREDLEARLTSIKKNYYTICGEMASLLKIPEVKRYVELSEQLKTSEQDIEIVQHLIKVERDREEFAKKPTNWSSTFGWR